MRKTKLRSASRQSIPKVEKEKSFSIDSWVRLTMSTHTWINTSLFEDYLYLRGTALISRTRLGLRKRFLWSGRASIKKLQQVHFVKFMARRMNFYLGFGIIVVVLLNEFSTLLSVVA